MESLERKVSQLEERVKVLEGRPGAPAGVVENPWAPLVEQVRQGARRAAAAMLGGAESERLSQLEPRVAELWQALHGGTATDRAAVEPSIYSMAADLKGQVTRARQIQPAQLPLPDLPPLDWAPDRAFLPDGRLALADQLKRWEEAAAGVLQRYYATCRRDREAQAGARSSLLQIQDRAVNLCILIYRAGLEALLPKARAVVEALGLTVVVPEPGRDYDVYTQDQLGVESSSDLPAGTVCRVVEPGFKRDGKLLIKAKVLVSGKRL
jgi:hypothetical protein